MYYIAPASLAFLSIPWFFIEAREVLNDPKVCLIGIFLPCLASTGPKENARTDSGPLGEMLLKTALFPEFMDV